MAKKAAKKRVYHVTFYYHTNCEVEVKSDKELSEEEVIAMAESEVERPKYRRQVLDGLEEDSSPDVCEE